MFEVRVETHFKASHQLAFSDGLQEPLHEHSWQVWVDINRNNLGRTGLVIDFHLLKQMAAQSVTELENRSLNEIEYFQVNIPSAENVAKYIFEKLESKLPNGVTLSSVRVFEQPGFSAKFTK